MSVEAAEDDSDVVWKGSPLYSHLLEHGLLDDDTSVEKRLEDERMDAIKKKEAARKTRERKREDERRRTQEIVLPPSNTFQRE